MKNVTEKKVIPQIKNITQIKVKIFQRGYLNGGRYVRKRL